MARKLIGIINKTSCREWSWVRSIKADCSHVFSPLHLKCSRLCTEDLRALDNLQLVKSNSFTNVKKEQNLFSKCELQMRSRVSLFIFEINLCFLQTLHSQSILVHLRPVISINNHMLYLPYCTCFCTVYRRGQPPGWQNMTNVPLQQSTDVLLPSSPILSTSPWF